MLKTSEKRDLSKLVQQKTQDAPEVRPFPVAVTQLLAACRDPNVTAAAFEKIIECDAALAARVLRMANSPLYGVAREVRSVAHATAFLGVRQLRNLALAVTGSTMFASGATAAEEREQLWSHSLGCATIARILAALCPTVPQDEAFLAGIFHDIGKLLLYDIAPEEYIQIHANCRLEDLVNEERSVFETSHQEIGMKSAQAWNLPEDIATTIGFHHEPQKAPAHSDFVRLIHFSNRLAFVWGIGSNATEDSSLIADASEQLEIDNDVLAGLEETCRDAFQKALSDWT